MKSNYLNTVFNMSEFAVPTQNGQYNASIKAAEEENVQQMHVADVIALIKRSEKYPLFEMSMDCIDEGILYSSKEHGVRHNERVAIFAMAMGIMQKLKDEELRTILQAAKYHDTGRKNDEEDHMHGVRSAMIIEREHLDGELPEDNKRILKAIVTGHSEDDKMFDHAARSFKVQDVDLCKKLFEILKDADALDRVRLGEDELDTNYLRTYEAKRMVPAAYELFHNYQIIEHRILEGER